MKSYDLLIVGSESGVIIFAFQGKQLLVTEPSDGYSADITYYFSEAKPLSANYCCFLVVKVASRGIIQICTNPSHRGVAALTPHRGFSRSHRHPLVPLF